MLYRSKPEGKHKGPKQEGCGKELPGNWLAGGWGGGGAIKECTADDLGQG